MSKPETNYKDPLHGAMSEIVSGQSALNMPAEAIKNPKGSYLSDTDAWANHAYEHFHAALELLNKAHMEREALKTEVYKLSLEIRKLKETK